MKTPDITAAQIVALVQAVLATAVAFGAPISEGQSMALMGLAGIIASVLFASDAAIRRERAKVVQARERLDLEREIQLAYDKQSGQ